MVENVCLRVIYVVQMQLYYLNSGFDENGTSRTRLSHFFSYTYEGIDHTEPNSPVMCLFYQYKASFCNLVTPVLRMTLPRVHALVQARKLLYFVATTSERRFRIENLPCVLSWSANSPISKRKTEAAAKEI